MTLHDKRIDKKKEIRHTIRQGPFADNWESLKRYEVPRWYADAKFGIFIHWGVYAVPAFRTEWYARKMYQAGTEEFEHHRNTYGPQEEFGYKDFVPRFTADKFDAEEWAALFKRAGANFVVPVAEHHDGFSMYDNPFSEWNAAVMGPKRDVIGELSEAVRRNYMTFGVSSHRAENWWYFNGGRQFPSDVQDPEYAELYGPAQACYGDLDYPLPIVQPNEEFLDDWLVRTCDLIDRYVPQLLYFDWWIEQPAFKPYLQKLAAHYYNRAAEWERGVVVNYKFDAFAEGTAVYDVERGQLEAINPEVWQTCTSVGETAWCHIADHKYKSSATLIGDLVDVVSKNGTLLLNIGPKADGTIPEEERTLLLEIGEWLAVNGEAIYATRPWTTFGEGPTRIVKGQFNDTKREPYVAEDIRFTTRGSHLYAIALGWPEEGRLLIRTLSADSEEYTSDIQAVELLGWEGELQWERTEEALSVQLPPILSGRPAYALKIVSEPDINPNKQ